jgi:DNA-binding protein HU-beta
MTKQELLKYLSTETNLPMSQLDKILSAVAECITKVITDGDKVSLPGLGTFSSKTRAARTGRNPKTGKEIKIPEKKIPYFSASSVLKDAVEK